MQREALLTKPTVHITQLSNAREKISHITQAQFGSGAAGLVWCIIFAPQYPHLIKPDSRCGFTRLPCRGFLRDLRSFCALCHEPGSMIAGYACDGMSSRFPFSAIPI